MELDGKVEEHISKLNNKDVKRKQQDTRIFGLEIKQKISPERAIIHQNLKEKQIHANSMKTAKDCKSAFKVNCATNIDKVKKFHSFDKLHTDSKHSFINQTSVASSIARNST